MLSALSYGDAIGNEALRIQSILRSQGYESEIFAEAVHPEMSGLARKLWEYREVSHPDNLLILHFSIGAGVSTYAYHLPDPLLLIYHNITPAHWFTEFHPHLVGLCHHGRRELAAFRGRARLALGDSEFNRAELESMGFQPTGVLPLMLEHRRWEIPPNPVVLEMFDDEKTNFLFVGRTLPNKCIEDVIKVFCYYQRFIDANSRLLLVGESHGFERYFDSLVRLADDLALEDVVFAGHVDTDDLVAYYTVADLFLSMSEHEGFCAPLVEAFRFDLPVLAYDAGAVAETLSGAGVLITEKAFDRIAEMVCLLVHDENMRESILAGQREVLSRMHAFDQEGLFMRFVERTQKG